VRLRVLDAAEAEATEAAGWYDDRQAGLGDDFLNEYATRLGQIESDPHRFPVLETVDSPHEIRRSLLRRFPYGIVNQMLKSEAIVLAVMHLSRRPDYWTFRVSQN
jgi:hypothetical protein